MVRRAAEAAAHHEGLIIPVIASESEATQLMVQPRAARRHRALTMIAGWVASLSLAMTVMGLPFTARHTRPLCNHSMQQNGDLLIFTATASIITRSTGFNRLKASRYSPDTRPKVVASRP